MAFSEDPEVFRLAYESPDGLWQIVFADPTWEVRIGPAVVDRFNTGDTLRERLGIVRLLESKVLTYREAARVFNLSYQRIGQLMQAYRQEGVLGLFPKEKGRRMRISVKARAQLIDLVENQNRPVWLAAERVYEQLGEYVSEKSGYAIIRKARGGAGAEDQVWGTPQMDAMLAKRELGLDGAEDLLPEEEMRSEPARDATDPCESVARPIPAEQTQTPSFSVVCHEATEAAPKQTAANCHDSENRPVAEEPTFRPAAAGREEAYLETLEAGVRVSHLGGFLVAGLIGKLGLVGIFQKLAMSVPRPKGGRRENNRYWDLPRILMTLVYAYLFRAQSIESLKTAEQESLGILVGAPQAPHVNRIREWVLEAAKARIGEPLRWLLATGYAALGWVRLGTLYIDGHFRPYYGSRKIASGWFSGRNVGHPGNYAYYVNDDRGRPVFLELTAASVSFTKILPKLVTDAKRLRAESKTPGPLIVVFDRGAYSKDLFTNMDEQQVVFVTWMKNPPQFLAGYFSQRISVSFSKTSRTFYYFQTRVQVAGYADNVKAFALRDPKTGHQMVAITNADRVRPEGKRIRLNHEPLIRVLVKRWIQENFFKEGKRKQAIDQHAGYLFEPEDPDAQIVHPLHKQLASKIQKAEAQLVPINEAFAALQVPRSKAATQRGRARVAAGTPVKTLEQQRRRLLSKLERFKEELRKTPSHIRHEDLPEDKKRLVVRFDKQTILEHLKSAAHNMTEMLLEQFCHHCYFDRRDPKPILHAIFTQPAYCQLRNGRLHVFPKPLDTPRYEAAALLLYDIVNDEAAGRTSDAFGFPILIDTGPLRDQVTW